MTWVKPEAIHITLRFLGELPETALEPLSRWTTAASGIPAAGFSIGSLNAFPNLKHPRTIFLDVSPHELFLALHERLENFLAGIGIIPEDRPYHPHITIGRVKSPSRSLPAGRQATQVSSDPSQSLPPFPTLPDTLRTVILFQSHLTSAGPIHTPLSSVSAPP